ncbi:Mu transposase C-terminal domain-containing protein [Roseovarius sp. ZX-A-9]|uniref:Mu transposase C-terminal domain-containing protein n=1 Tax=Roseovarius sp. ZX-A-9 TaxID=3014783 RepID=UPI00232D5C0D|nr:Mu transposase C-terminal domain-containing protein [Roseovarius sp. ZX-A-9]
MVAGKDPEGYVVEGLDDGECITISYKRVDDAIRAGNCEVISPSQLEAAKRLSDFTGGYTRMAQLPVKEQVDVRKRLILVLAIERLEAEGHKITQRFLCRADIRKRLKDLGDEIGGEKGLFSARRTGKTEASFEILSGRTLQKYLKLYREYGENPVALMHRENLKGPQGDARKKLNTFQERFIDYVIKHFLNATKVKLAPLFELAKTQFLPAVEGIAQGFEFPSITTIRTRLKAVSATIKTLGREGKRQGPNLKGAGSTDIRALMFGERTEVDQVLLSIFTDKSGQLSCRTMSRSEAAKKADELDPDEIQRSWLNLTCDVASGMPLGWVLSETADADHSMALFRMATRDKTREKVRYGCEREPAPAVGLMISSADNGTATRNGKVRAGQLGVGMTAIDGRTYHATDKPYVESKFGTLQWQVLNFLPGYAGSKPGELPGYDPKGSAKLTHEQLFGIITRYFVDEYPFAASRGTGMFGATPYQKMEELIETYGPIEPPGQEDRRIHLGVSRTVSITSEGVKIFNLPYNSTQLQQYADKAADKKVTVHLDPDDLRKVSITIEGSNKILHARLTMTALNDLTLNEAIELMTAAVAANPVKRQLYEDHLWKAKERRAKEMGFFSSPLVPDSYLGVEALQKAADALLAVEFVPSGPSAPTVPPSGIMDRGGHPAVHKVTGPPTAIKRPQSEKPSSAASSPIFKPIKESKL